MQFISIFQTFPEPLYFNKDTGGFEVVSEAKKELAKKIKEALRSQARTPRIYRVAKKHSFIDIPLIPIENGKGPENQEIHTSFAVTVSVFMKVSGFFCQLKIFNDTRYNNDEQYGRVLFHMTKAL